MGNESPRKSPRRVDEIDWASWRPVDLATLVFVVRDHEVLLIRKKRGLGAGKINAPGGRLDDGETPLQCAVREVEEELLITPGGLAERGQLRFQFVDGYSIHVWVYRAGGFTGEPTETAEAIPLWFGRHDLPYDEMWEDDRVWLPILLEDAGDEFRFDSIFEEDRMLDYRLWRA